MQNEIVKQFNPRYPNGLGGLTVQPSPAAPEDEAEVYLHGEKVADIYKIPTGARPWKFVVVSRGPINSFASLKGLVNGIWTSHIERWYARFRPTRDGGSG